MAPTPKTACDRTFSGGKSRFLDLALRAAVFVLAVAALAHLAGCSGRALPIAVHDARAEPLELDATGLPAPVADACDLLAVACEGAGPDAPIALSLFPDESAAGLRELGRQLVHAPCYRAAWSTDYAVAHELGHMLELEAIEIAEHPEARANVMAHPEQNVEDEATEDQLDQAAAEAGRLAGCP